MAMKLLLAAAFVCLVTGWSRAEDGTAKLEPGKAITIEFPEMPSVPFSSSHNRHKWYGNY